MIVVFLTPAVLSYLLVFLYPSIRTIFTSFFYMKFVTAPLSQWKYVGLKNYWLILNSYMFRRSLYNIFYIWLFGGTVVFFTAIVYAIVLTSGVKGKSFFRAVLYLPNVITAIALATMWLHYAFNSQYGLFHTIFSTLGLEKMANFQWTAAKHKLFSMTVAFSFGSVGYFMVIVMAGIEKIPTDFFEAAILEGANVYQKFRRITAPLILGVIKMGMVIWSIAVVAFFIWSKMFSPIDPEIGTVTPMVYMYELTFGRMVATNPELMNAGAGAAVGVVMTLLILVVFAAVNYLLPEQEKLEY